MNNLLSSLSTAGMLSLWKVTCSPTARIHGRRCRVWKISW